MLPLIYPPQKLHFTMMPHVTRPPVQRRELHDEEDLASIALQIQRKRFYVDVKKNQRGIFMKIAEVGVDGRKARIILTLGAAAEIKDKLKDLIEVLESVMKNDENDVEASPTSDDQALEPKMKTEQSSSDTNGEVKILENASGDGLIKSHIVNFRLRRYFLDLKKNRRGYFLRLTMLSTASRTQLAVPSQGMVELYNAINSLLEKWWDGSKIDELKTVNLPESKFLRVDNRTLYFDSACNRYGPFLRISEVRSSSRTAITIPSRSLFRFRDIINGLTDDLTNTKIDKMIDESPAVESDVKEPLPAAEGDSPT